MEPVIIPTSPLLHHHRSLPSKTWRNPSKLISHPALLIIDMQNGSYHAGAEDAEYGFVRYGYLTAVEGKGSRIIWSLRV